MLHALRWLEAPLKNMPPTKLLYTSLLNIGRFSQFFHWHTLRPIFAKTVSQRIVKVHQYLEKIRTKVWWRVFFRLTAYIIYVHNGLLLCQTAGS